jgi:hypothetical protein
MENAAETENYSDQDRMNNDDNDDDDDDDLMTMDFPVATTTTKDSSTPPKPAKPASHTTWNDKAIMECLEFSLEAYQNGTALKEWKAPRNNIQHWVPTVMAMPGWLKGI